MQSPEAREGGAVTLGTHAARGREAACYRHCYQIKQESELRRWLHCVLQSQLLLQSLGRQESRRWRALQGGNLLDHALHASMQVSARHAVGDT